MLSSDKMGWSVEIVGSTSTNDIVAVKDLWNEYWRSSGLSLDFQGFGEELREFPGKYVQPSGCLFLVRIDGRPAATAAFHRLHAHACEAKHLYVRPVYRNPVWPVR